MVMENIHFLLKQFIHCTAYQNVIFCRVMHRQEILNEVLAGLDLTDCVVKTISLVCNPDSLMERLKRDVQNGIRKEDVIARSLERLQSYEELDTVKIDTSGKCVEEVLQEILEV